MRPAVEKGESMAKELPEPVFLSAPKAATLCGVSRNTVCCWIREGKLPSYRTAGGKNLIRPSDLVDFMRSNTMFVPQSLVELASEDEATMGDSNDKEKATSQEPSILVVDDNADARKLAVRSLTPVGLPLLEAETGYEALHLLVHHPEIALIVLDLIMPGQHGVETFREIRKQNQGIPVIVVTGMPMDENEPLFGELEPDLIITKPYAPSDLIKAAEAFVADLGL